jgi:hypothetical protein
MTDDPSTQRDDEPVPKLPRGRGLRLSGMQLIRMIGLAAVLIFLLVSQRPCADAVSKFVTGFGSGSAGTGSAGSNGSGSSGAGSAGSGAGSQQYERLRPDMTPDEMKAAIERAKARAAGSGSGS